VILATLVSRDSFSRTPTSAWTGEHTKHAITSARAGRLARSVRVKRPLVDVKNLFDGVSKRTDAVLLYWTQIATYNLKSHDCAAVIG
jgi:hypothetical protein